MTDAHRRTICQALAYVIKELVPVPKTVKAKAARAELLQDLINAGRPSSVPVTDVPIHGTSVTGVTSTPSPQQPPPGEGVALSIAVVMPDGPIIPTVRPGTVHGVPVDPKKNILSDEEEHHR